MFRNTIYSICALFALVVFSASSLAATSNDCYTTFYKSKNFECIDGIVNEVEKIAEKLPEKHHFDHSNIQAISGFLAELFIKYPDKKNELLKKDVSPYTKSVFIESLYRADLTKEAKEYAYNNSLGEIYDTYKKYSVKKISELRPKYIPSDNDVLIGAFMATGDNEFISNILYNFKRSDKSMVKDAIRVSLVQSKFGPKLSPPNRTSNMMANLCTKYECKKNKKDLFHTMTLVTAFWSLNSLSKEHEIIKETFTKFFEQDKDLKNIVLIENNNFSNYALTLAMSTATNKVEGDKDIKIHNKEGMEEFLQSFERLEDVDVKALMQK